MQCPHDEGPPSRDGSATILAQLNFSECKARA